jgi:D-beta-D-heptose 7-phosphate kinase/D-beta-D-heptose 1-phosphate adenosyltransferase
MSTLLDALARWKPFTALVVGDFMLDRQLYGDAERLSADAPVPVLHVRRETHNPGGAANVCLDLVAMGGRVLAAGVTGDDADGRTLRMELEKSGVTSAGLVADPTRPTTVKQNLIGLAQARHPQKMFRVDFESCEPVSPSVRGALLEAVARAITGADVVCIEDYGKGVCSAEVCQAVIKLARAAKKPVLVDPAKIEDYGRYRGATAITPNRTEAELASGLETDGEASPERNGRLARALLEKHDLDAVVLTLDKHGALLLERGGSGEPVAIPTVAREVYDVTGAGDMVLAGLAAALANGCSWADAVRFANAAAGLEVEVFGVVPIPLERIHHSILMHESGIGGGGGKLRTLAQTLVQVAAAKKEGRKVVFTNGCFDVLHSGHVTLLEKAAKLGDLLVVGLNDDESVRGLKGPGRPVNTAEDRARVLGALEAVGAVVLFGDATPVKLIEAIKPDVLVKGADYTKDKVVGGAFVESYGGEVALIDLVEGKSSSVMIKKMRAQ